MPPSPPHDIAAEQAALGAVLIDADAPLPPASDFYRDSHRLIAEGIESLRARSAPVDLITLSAELRDLGTLAEAGGPAEIDALIGMVGSSAHAAYYCAIVRERARERDAQKLFTDFNNCLEKGIAMRRLMPRFLKAFSALNVISQEPTEMQDALNELAADIDSGRQAERLFLGIDTLDEMLQGVRTKQVVVIGGAPATGKSALALQIGVSLACAVGPVGFTSQEMRADEVAERVAAQWTSRSVRSVTKDSAAVRGVARELEGVRCPIYDWRMTPGDWCAHMRALKAAHPNMSAFVLDYVQLMKREDGKANVEAKEHEFLQDVMPLAKGLAQELNVVGFVLAQLKADARTAGIEPSGESFRGPAILENADKAFVLWRSNDSGLYAKVVKNRQGPTGNVSVCFDADSVTFRVPGAKPGKPGRRSAVLTAPLAFEDVPI